MNHTPNENETRSVLSTLRALVPQREATFTEALRVAEQQAQRFLRRLQVMTGPVPDDTLLDLPRLAVEYTGGMPTSGCSFWDNDRRTWIIQVNRDEPPTRQRFTLFHEYKHIVDHGRTDQLYGTGWDAGKHAEQAADYFAGCVLMPRPLVKRAWCQGIQTTDQLAAWFDVSPVAARVRLAQIGIADDEQVACCLPSRAVRTWASRTDFRSYYRQLSTRPLDLQETS